MSVLWCGGEDTSFPIGLPAVTMTATGARAGYSQGAVQNNTIAMTNFVQSNPFAGGAVTSAWLSFRWSGNQSITAKPWLVVSLSGSSKGLGLGLSSTGKLSLYTVDGDTPTLLAAESGTSVSGGQQKFDIQVISYGATATVNVYVNGVQVIAFSGDVTVSGMTNFDSVSLPGVTGGGGGFISEVIVATDDTRPWLGLRTITPSGPGTTNEFSNNAFSNVNGIPFSDATPAYSNTVNQVQEYNATDLPSGIFVIGAVKVETRAAKSPGSTPTKIEIGYNDGGTVSLGPDQALATSYTTYERLDLLNPNGSVAWDQSIMSALQLAVKSIA